MTEDEYNRLMDKRIRGPVPVNVIRGWDPSDRFPPSTGSLVADAIATIRRGLNKPDNWGDALDGASLYRAEAEALLAFVEGARGACEGADTQYLNLLSRILNDGAPKDDRTRIGTLSVFGHQMRFDLARGFPLITTKKVSFGTIINELIWFLAGDTNVRTLNAAGVHIWDAWADETGELGPVYGRQWRPWPTPDGGSIDQIANVVSDIRCNPDSRRLIVTAWNPADVDRMALPPCHCLFQFYVAEGRLSLCLYQRSADAFIGVPFNIASYALLTMMVAKVTGLEAGEFVHFIADAHLYRNHLDQAREQLTRAPRPLPQVKLNAAVSDLLTFRAEDIVLEGYDPHPPIKATVAV